MDSDEALEIIQAYELAFASVAGIKVLRDLNQVVGFMSTWPVGTDPSVLTDHNAARRVFGRIYEILMSTERGREAMTEAFRPVTTKE